MSSQVVTSRFDDWTSALTLSCNYRFSIELSLGQLFAMMMAIFNRSRRWRKLTNKIMQNYCKVSNFPAIEWNGKENLCSAFSSCRPQWVCVNKEWESERWKWIALNIENFILCIIEKSSSRTTRREKRKLVENSAFNFSYLIFPFSHPPNWSIISTVAALLTQIHTYSHSHRLPPFRFGDCLDRKFNFNWIFTQFLLLKNLRNLNRFYMVASLSESFRVWLADSQYIHACVFFLLCVECDWLALLSRLVCFTPFSLPISFSLLHKSAENAFSTAASQPSHSAIPGAQRRETRWKLCENSIPINSRPQIESL